MTRRIASAVCGACLAGVAYAQERPVPSDSARVAIPGCAKDRTFIVGTTPKHEPTQVEIAPGRRFRLSGEGRMIEVTGLVRKAALTGPGGIPVAGGRIRIGAGLPQSPTGDPAHTLSGYDQAVLDVEGWRLLDENCSVK